ncbi:MAG: metal-sensitive transcriptional regulator [Thermanaerothrix sp.]|nr:metal-sensitive transcriptional regulator [Thermanaerothrix sp.]
MINRLRRLEGQIRGIQKMIEDEKPCKDILIQLNAARRAMQNASIAVLKNYLNKCIAQAGSEAPRERMEELERLIKAMIDLTPLDGDQ